MSRTLLLLLLLLSQAFTQVPLPDHVNLIHVNLASCNKTHGLLKLLQDQRVLVFDAPQKTHIEHCQLEWTKFGTCCDQASLKAFAEHDSQEIQNSVESLEEKLNSIAKSFSDLIDTSELIIREQIALELDADVLLDTIVDGETKKLKEFINSYFFATKEQNSMQDCWKQMARIRSNALCGVCSGRSEVYFSDQDKARFLSMDCQPMLDSCLNSFNDVVKLIEGVDRFADKFIDSTR